MANDTSKTSREADHWKKKYYDSLDDLDERQREWSQLEKQLRLLVSRLTLIAEPHDSKLDKQLTKLRNQVRDSSDLSRLQSLFGDVSSAIASLPEQGPNKAERENPAHALQLLLDQLTIPADLARQEKYVRKKLDRVASISDVPDAVRVLVELLTLVIGQEPEENEPQAGDESTESAQRRGLFSSLFRRESGTELKTDSGSGTPAVTTPRTEPDADLSTLANGEVSTQVMNSDEIDCALAGDILIQLLERIDFSDELAVESELIRQRLEPCEDIEKLNNGLNATVDLIASLQGKISSEKKELESFLLQLTGRLQELDKDIQNTAKLRDASLSDSRDMQRAVSTEVNSIQQSVNDALELDSLKTAIQSRVVIIRNHVDRFLQDEEQRGGEAQQIIQRLENQLRATEQESEKLREQVKKAQHKAETDSLTEIPNRMAYDKRLAEELARHKRYQTDFVLMLWDIDRFKWVNDTYGHAAGDKVLKVVASVMQKQLRETDFMARFGGEEFAIILVETGLQAAETVGEKLRQGIESLEFHFRGTRVPITASCGITAAATDETAETLFDRADSALYRAKEGGRNRVETS